MRDPVSHFLFKPDPVRIGFFNILYLIFDFILNTKNRFRLAGLYPDFW